MNRDIIILILHIACAIIWAACSIMANIKSQKIMYAVCAALWGICVVLDIVKLAV